MDRERELELRLERYQVTTVPAGSHLRLVWSAPDAPASDGSAPGGVVEDDADETGTVALLSSYRITRVPSRAAG